MVVSGAPVVSKFHAVYIADMAFDVLSTMARLPDPSRAGEHLKVRLGNLIKNLVFLEIFVRMIGTN